MSSSLIEPTLDTSLYEVKIGKSAPSSSQDKWTQRCKVHCEQFFYSKSIKALFKGHFLKFEALLSKFFFYSSGSLSPLLF